MAHNINETNGKHSFFSVKEKAWHGLGQIVQDYPTSAEAIKFAGLDYTVEKRPLRTLDNDGAAEIEVPGYFSTVRTDTQAVLGVVGANYHVIQNRDAFTFFDAIVEGEGILYETAGALGKGERIFITAKLPNYIRVGNDDLIEKYLFLTTSHDGTGSITAAFTPIRIVCNNTLNAALRNCSNVVKIRHTINAKDRLAQAHKVMGIANKLSQELEGIFNQWAKIRITDQQVKALIQQALKPQKEQVTDMNADELSTYVKNVTDLVYEYAMTAPSQQIETTRGTLFGAYNSVTGYFQNVKDYKDSEAKLNALLFGGTSQVKSQVAFNLCERFEKVGASALLLN